MAIKRTVDRTMPFKTDVKMNWFYFGLAVLSLASAEVLPSE